MIMMMIETRQAAKDKVFDLFEETKELDRLRKLIICKLEEALYECFESLKEDEEYESDEYDHDDKKMEYRSGKAYRRSHRDMHDDEDEDMLFSYPRYRTHMRRNRSGRYSY